MVVWAQMWSLREALKIFVKFKKISQIRGGSFSPNFFVFFLVNIFCTKNIQKCYKHMILIHATWRLSSGWNAGCYGAPGQQCGCNLHLHLIYVYMWDNRARNEKKVYSETFVVEKRGCWFWPPGGHSREKPPLMGTVNWVQKHVLGKC